MNIFLYDSCREDWKENPEKNRDLDSELVGLFEQSRLLRLRMCRTSSTPVLFSFLTGKNQTEFSSWYKCNNIHPISALQFNLPLLPECWEVPWKKQQADVLTVVHLQKYAKKVVLETTVQFLKSFPLRIWKGWHFYSTSKSSLSALNSQKQLVHFSMRVIIIWNCRVIQI